MDALSSLNAAVDFARQAGLLESCHLTIVDNGGNQLDGLVPSYSSLIVNDSNIGFGAAHNQALSKTDSDIHLFLNPDLIVSTDTLAMVLKAFISSASLVACNPRGNDPNGNDLYLCKRYPSVFDLMLRGFAPGWIKKSFDRRLARYEYREVDHSTAREVTLLSGCCMFVRTQAAKSIDGFDSRFFLYFEDYDLSLRLAAFGKILYLPGAKVIHLGGHSAKKGLRHIAMFCSSAFKFYQKHYWRFI